MLYIMLDRVFVVRLPIQTSFNPGIDSQVASMLVVSVCVISMYRCVCCFRTCA